MRKEMTVVDKLQRTFNNLPQEKKDRINRILENYEETVFSTPHEPNNEDRLEQEITTLREQVEKLTKERDTEIARTRPLQSLIKLTEETKSFLLKKSEENKEAVKQLDSERQANAVLTEELAALAEQNEKMRDTLIAVSIAWSSNDVYIAHFFHEALSLPDLATPVLNRIKADGMREAAKFCINNPLSDAHSLAEMLRAKADELENSN